MTTANTYVLHLRCPQCAGPLIHVNATGMGWSDRACAVAECRPCRREVSILVQMVVREGRTIDHGTEPGYNAHYRQGTKPCDPCSDAHNEYHRSYRRSKVSV